MKIMYSILKILASLIIISMVAIVEAVDCPAYCRCSVTNSYRHVKCVGHHLISVELDVPRNVQWLELSNNSIFELSDHIFLNLGLERIIFLDLSHNAINSISLNAFYGLEQIQVIDLSGNHLYRIDSATFEHVPSLQHLILNSNPLRHFPMHKPFLISKTLKILEISHCRLSYLPPDSFETLPSLESLNISNNAILALHEDLLNSMEHLTELDITDTHIKCDSSSTYLMDWALTRSVRIIGSPCTAAVNEFTKDDVREAKKFEKIVMGGPLDDEDVDDNYEEFSYDVNHSKECICPNDNLNDYERLLKTTKKTPVVETTKNKSQNDYRSMLWLAFLNGLVTGAALSSSAIVFWIYCCKYRTRVNARRRRQTVEQYDNIPCETPPPSYSDLF